MVLLLTYIVVSECEDKDDLCKVYADKDKEKHCSDKNVKELCPKYCNACPSKKTVYTLNSDS